MVWPSSVSSDLGCMGDHVIVPSPLGASAYSEPAAMQVSEALELARQHQEGARVLEKHILTMGELKHPKTGAVIKIDDDFVTKLQANHRAGVCPHVQLPLADEQNKHDERPDRNLGEVLDIRQRGGKVYAVLDARKHQEDFGKTLLGASAFLDLNYEDTRTQEKVGPTLLHVAVTNRPHLVDLEDFTDTVAASADLSSDDVVVLSYPEEKTVPLTKDELLDQLKADHGVDVAALQAQLSARADPDEFKTVITAALTEAAAKGTVQLSADGQLSASDVAGAVAELAHNSVALSSRVVTLERDKAAIEVDQMVKAGRIMPKSRDDMLELRLTNPAMYERLLPAAEDPIVQLNHQSGLPPDETAKRTADIDAELIRLTTQGSTSKFFQPGGRSSPGAMPAAVSNGQAG